MKVTGMDERNLVEERRGANFVVFIYEGGGARQTSWSVRSLLITEADVPQVLRWLQENLPADSCWSLGVVLNPGHPTAESDLDVAWVVGADVLNRDAGDRESEHRRLTDEMLARRHRAELP